MEKKEKIEEPAPYRAWPWYGVEKNQIKIAIVAGLIALFVLGVYGFSAYAPDDLKILPEKKEPVVILFVGDIMLDRGVRNAINREGASYPFEALRELLASADVSVGNLEGVFTDNPSLSLMDNSILRFTFEPRLVAMLKEFGFSGFSLANNHSLDFGREGFENTRTLLAENGMFSFGSPLNDYNLSYKVSAKGREVCIVGYHSLYREDPSTAIAEISKLRPDCDFLAVVSHWGDEYQNEENEAQRRLGKIFIDAGADLVVGHHPHVVQPVEIYKGKAIFYSLGNFLFDQDFSLATRQSLAVRLTLGEDYQEFHLIPVEMSRARLYYPEHEAYQARRGILVSKLPEPYRTSALVDSVFTLDFGD